MKRLLTKENVPSIEHHAKKEQQDELSCSSRDGKNSLQKEGGAHLINCFLNQAFIRGGGRSFEEIQ